MIYCTCYYCVWELFCFVIVIYRFITILNCIFIVIYRLLHLIVYLRNGLGNTRSGAITILEQFDTDTIYNSPIPVNKSIDRRYIVHPSKASCSFSIGINDWHPLKQDSGINHPNTVLQPRLLILLVRTQHWYCTRRAKPKFGNNFPPFSV